MNNAGDIRIVVNDIGYTRTDFTEEILEQIRKATEALVEDGSQRVIELCKMIDHLNRVIDAIYAQPVAAWIDTDGNLVCDATSEEHPVRFLRSDAVPADWWQLVPLPKRELVPDAPSMSQALHQADDILAANGEGQ